MGVRSFSIYHKIHYIKVCYIKIWAYIYIWLFFLNSRLDCKDFEDDMSRKSSSASTITFANPDKAMTIIDGGFVEEAIENNNNNMVAEKRNKISTASSHIINLRRKTAIQLLHGRKKSADKVRKFKSTMKGLRNDTEYVIKISFVLSGRKLGSESYRI